VIRADDRASAVDYEVLDAASFEAAIPDLAELIVDAVDSGASVNFLRGFSVDEGVAWWSARRADVARGAVRPIVARLNGNIVGVALLVPTLKPNSPHRAEVNKVIVHRGARGRGIGSGLMRAIEELALAKGHWLLVLDTTAGSDAERLYRRLGWTRFGEVPNHALTADGALSDTTYFFKDLRDHQE
jgi:GNAT superfamily N-acetyltransferase